MNTLGLFLPKHDIDINNKAQQIDDLKHWTDFTFKIILLLHVTPQLIGCSRFAARGSQDYVGLIWVNADYFANIWDNYFVVNRNRTNAIKIAVFTVLDIDIYCTIPISMV